ncbi:MAG: hypothetical protein WBN23_14890 [Woeseia sp.]
MSRSIFPNIALSTCGQSFALAPPSCNSAGVMPCKYVWLTFPQDRCPILSIAALEANGALLHVAVLD